MSKIGIVTDSNSGITQEDGAKYGIHIVPMTFCIDDVEYVEGRGLEDEQFFDFQRGDAKISTMQPTIQGLVDLWEELLETYDQLIHIPMSEALSGSYQTAAVVAQHFEGKVYVVNAKRISVTQKDAAFRALELAEEGKTAEEIKEYIENVALDASIYITVDTLKYLKQGGRIAPTIAAIGEVLNIKPVIQIQGGLLEEYSKVRGKNKAKKIMEEAIQKDLSERFARQKEEMQTHYYLAYAGEEARQEAEQWAEHLQEVFPGCKFRIERLPLSICCHVGVGTVGIGVSFV